MTKYDSSQSVTMGIKLLLAKSYHGGGYLDNKIHPLIEDKIKKVVFVVETTFSRVHFLDPPIDFITTRKGEEWR